MCRTWFESECNTTYIESPSGDHKPNTWCQKMPKKICAPDNCNMVQVNFVGQKNYETKSRGQFDNYCNFVLLQSFYLTANLTAWCTIECQLPTFNQR